MKDENTSADIKKAFSSQNQVRTITNRTLDIDVYKRQDIPYLTELVTRQCPVRFKELAVYYADLNNFRPAFEKFYNMTLASQKESFAANSSNISELPSSEQSALLDKILQTAINMNASDIHLTCLLYTSRCV